MGDEERIVGADSLIYCPSDQRHSITNVGKGLAKILRISGCNDGAKMGGPVWSKMPSGELNAHKWGIARTSEAKNPKNKNLVIIKYLI